jgi:hypothetical protein
MSASANPLCKYGAPQPLDGELNVTTEANEATNQGGTAVDRGADQAGGQRCRPNREVEAERRAHH